MNTRILSAAAVAALMSLSAALPAFAQAGDDLPNMADNSAAAINASASVTGTAGTNVRMAVDTKAMGSTTAANMQQRMDNAETRAASEISARIDALNKLLARIQSMKNLSASQKASFQTTIQASVSDMTSLQAKIQADTTAATLMADMKTIAPDYRIYMLVDPQLSLLSASDRVNTIVGTLQTLETKINARITAAGSTPNASWQSTLSDMTAKLSDASTQSAAASAEVSGLMPDNGVQSVQQSNTAALKDARAKIKTATSDLQAAYKDAQTVVAGVKALKPVKASASASTTTTTP